MILSPTFFAKEWPQKELDGLVQRESKGEKVILPVWHNLDAEQIRANSPSLADRVGVRSSLGLAQVVAEILRAMGHSPSNPHEPTIASSMRCPVHGQSPFEQVASNLWIESDSGSSYQQTMAFCSKCLDDYNARGAEVARKVAEICVERYGGHHWIERRFDDPHDSMLEYTYTLCERCGTVKDQIVTAR